MIQQVKTIWIDSHQVLTDCMKQVGEAVLGLDVVATYKRGDEALADLSAIDAALLILELNLPDCDGLDLIPKLKKTNRDLKILVLTSYSKSKFVKESLKNGADGYLLKTENLNVLKSAIQSVMSDETYIGEGLYITPPAGSLGKPDSDHGTNGTIYEDRYTIREKLTKREIEILALIAQAKNNREIASELYISDQTVGVHRKNMMKKLGVHNTVNLVKIALEYQLVE